MTNKNETLEGILRNLERIAGSLDTITMLLIQHYGEQKLYTECPLYPEEKPPDPPPDWSDHTPTMIPEASSNAVTYSIRLHGSVVEVPS